MAPKSRKRNQPPDESTPSGAKRARLHPPPANSDLEDNITVAPGVTPQARSSTPLNAKSSRSDASKVRFRQSDNTADNEEDATALSVDNGKRVKQALNQSRASTTQPTILSATKKSATKTKGPMTDDLDDHPTQPGPVSSSTTTPWLSAASSKSKISLSAKGKGAKQEEGDDGGNGQDERVPVRKTGTSQPSKWWSFATGSKESTVLTDEGETSIEGTTGLSFKPLTKQSGKFTMQLVPKKASTASPALTKPPIRQQSSQAAPTQLPAQAPEVLPPPGKYPSNRTSKQNAARDAKEAAQAIAEGRAGDTARLAARRLVDDSKTLGKLTDAYLNKTIETLPDVGTMQADLQTAVGLASQYMLGFEGMEDAQTGDLGGQRQKAKAKDMYDDMKTVLRIGAKWMGVLEGTVKEVEDEDDE
ncbi:hypothetical protein C1H76_2015 [Elsinoe australis]|uniref:Uncharacterized protein n=1 Tax=Elsinoe australis TaxID=40998 RepID=A0A4U7B9V9_9PEZI|nr:hypothetical protein C1H76_2015 [Elsinoe australis]